MTKKHKQNKKITEISSELSKQCQISTKPKFTPSGNTVLYDNINPALLAKWPKLKLKVPPIFLHKPIDFEEHVKKVLQMGINFYMPHLTTNYIKITCQTFKDHKYLVQYLEKKQLPYHTFGNPSKRKMKVVIWGLPHDIDLDVIKEELKSVSIPVIRVHKMQTRKDRKRIKMLVLAVVPYDDDGQLILKLKQLLGHDVKLEPPKNKPRQCYRCQKWGHSQRYCHGQIKCVKCSGEHFSKKCEKTPEENPKCANCGEAHTASYRVCRYAYEPEVLKMVHFITNLKRPCYEPQELVTLENYDTLYQNLKANKITKFI